jgi:predicted dehydrogenase
MADRYARIMVENAEEAGVKHMTYFTWYWPPSHRLDPANDSAMLILEFESGAVGLIHVSIVAHMADRPFEQYAILHGDLGNLEAGFDLSRGHTVQGAHHDEEAFRSLAI